jgi:hypothetical protein
MPELLELPEVERADMIDELTRKAFVLMEAGDIDEATTMLNRASAMSTVLAGLDEDGEDEEDEEDLEEDELDIEALLISGDSYERGDNEILPKLRRELDREDFIGIFGGKYSEFIGGF